MLRPAMILVDARPSAERSHRQPRCSSNRTRIPHLVVVTCFVENGSVRIVTPARVDTDPGALTVVFAVITRSLGATYAQSIASLCKENVMQITTASKRFDDRPRVLPDEFPSGADIPLSSEHVSA
jgi:hypothetical protein